MRKVIIVGGGFAGATAAKELERFFDVTLVDDKNYFEFTPAVLRTIIKPRKINKIQVLHQHYLWKTQIVFGQVKKIHKNKIEVQELTGKRQIFFDYLIVASGSSYNEPIKEEKIISSTRADILKNVFNEVKAAKKILVVGGGLAGVELAAELARYNDKEIMLLHSGKRLLERQPLKAQVKAERFLRRKGVDIIFEEKFLRDIDHTFVTDTGRKISADLVFLCTGICPNASFMKKFKLNEKGFVHVNDFFQVLGYENIFAIGDVNNIVEEKTAQAAEDHGRLISKNLLRLEKGNALKKYFPESKPFVISLGNYNGILSYKNFVIAGIIPAFMKVLVEKWFMFKLRHL